MPASETHNEIVLRPPPGTRFYIWQSDVRLEFQRGREREVIEWLRNWIDTYIEPEAQKVEAYQAAASNSEIKPSIPNPPFPYNFPNPHPITNAPVSGVPTPVTATPVIKVEKEVVDADAETGDSVPTMAPPTPQRLPQQPPLEQAKAIASMVEQKKKEIIANNLVKAKMQAAMPTIRGMLDDIMSKGKSETNGVTDTHIEKKEE